MANGDPFLAGTGGNLETGADQGGEAQAALANVMQPNGAAAPAAAPAAGGAAPGGGGYDPLSGISQLMGSLNQMPGTPQVPAAANVQQRHGGVLTGLVGVLLDGLASGMAPTTQQAWERPQQRQQLQMQQQQQQMQMQELQMRQQQAQQEMALAPLKIKYEMAQTLTNMMHADAAYRDLKKEHQIDVLGVGAKYMQQSVDEGRARQDATAPDLKSAQARAQQLQAQNKDTALNFAVLPTKWDDQENPTEYGVFESYPKGTLQKDFDYVLKGDKKLGVDDEPIHITAGTLESEAQLKTSTMVANHGNAMRLAEEKTRIAAEGQVTPAMIWKQKEEAYQHEMDRRQAQLDKYQYAGTEAIQKSFTDPARGYTQFKAQADSTLEAIRAAKSGDELAGSMERMMLVLGVSSFAGIHRVSQTEIDMAGPEVGSVYRQINDMLSKAGTGKPSTATLNEASGLINKLIDAKHRTTLQGAQMIAAGSKLDPSQVPVMNRNGDLDTLSNQLTRMRGGAGGGATPPKVGDIVKGHRYLGGPPNDPKSWQKVQ